MNSSHLEDLLRRRAEVTTAVDDRSRFYLENHELIETWAELRDDASRTLANAIHDLAAPLADDLRVLGEEPVVSNTVGPRPAVQLARASWGRDGHSSPIVVGLEWDKRPLTSVGALRAYAAVIAPRGHELAETTEPSLQGLSDRLAAQLGSQWQRNLPRWPIWKHLDAPEEPWTVEEIANRARDAVLRLWTVAAPQIDLALAPQR